MAGLTAESTPLPGLVLLRPTCHTDERGTFFRSFCRDTLAEHGIYFEVTQCSVSSNVEKHTLRGMHYQCAPYAEDKLVRCTSGAIYDVALDLRPEAPTHRQWFSVELSEQNGLSLYIPKGFAHGFCSIEEHSTVLYYMNENYCPEAAAGVRWDDEAFGISWPCTSPQLSPRDASYPNVV
ncbi:MAG: dTDP-4-dehydrorhamnose 3,5-epimerase [Verrucomicrobia bacterium]|nr:dTDP-4-dehydrorhamnose 3,5-epimerase [Verrucomicrobiota bacterium]